MQRFFIATALTLCAAGASAATFPAPTLYPSFTSRSGQFTLIDVPNAPGTIPVAINNKGEIAGYTGAGSEGYRGFIRRANGTFATFDAHKHADTFVYDMNGNGDVVGNYGSFNPSDPLHGFVRKASGKIVTFDVPGVTQINPMAINMKGEIVGTFKAGELF